MIDDPAGAGRDAARPARARLRWTVVDPARTGVRADVAVRAPAGAPLSLLHPALLAAVGRADGPGTGLFVDGVAVDGAAVGAPPLLDGAVLVVGRPGGVPGRAAGTSGALLEVHVATGPDAGARLPLARGAVRVGRAAGAALQVADPDLSRLHLEVERGAAAVSVRDLGSTNGTALDGHPVDGRPRAWPVGGTLAAGASTLVLRACDGAPAAGGGPAATHPDGAGHLLVNPAPRLREPLPPARVELPAPPGEPARSRLPWVTALLPLLVSVPMAWWLRQPTFLAFAALSPVLVIGQYLADTRARAADHAAALARHADLDARARARLSARLATEAARLHDDHPDLAVVSATAAVPLQRLWERRRADPDVLRLRLGQGDRRAAVELVDHGDGEPAAPVLTGVPVTLDLVSAGVTGLAGPRREVLGLARALVGQAVVWHSPADLQVVVLAAGADRARDWAWTAWLPHAEGTPPRPRQGRDPREAAEPPGAVTTTRTLLVLDGADRLRRDPAVRALLAAGATRGTVTLCLADDGTRLPAECGATVVLGEPGPARLERRDAAPQPLRPDLASPAWAERLARDLARLRDATPAGADAALPAEARLVDLLAASAAGQAGRAGRAGPPAPAGPVIDARAVAAGWAERRAQRRPATTVPIGRTVGGVLELDLRRDGPHALVAGTTGAGKSELLTTLVAGLAARHPPDRLQVLLVDYKGGTAFGPLADLPHTVGLLTDLDAPHARRALASLQAELRRREALLRAAGAADLDRYENARPAAVPPLPRLLVAVDEFRVLAEELPELLAGLVRIAAVGRSLGIHLVLATQRPSGVVSAEIRANTNLRIALRVQDRADSEDVVDVPDAAAVPADRPGRGLLRAGGGDPVPFQAARATGVGAAPEGVQVVRVRTDDAVPTRWRSRPDEPAAPACPAGPDDPAPPDDLERLVTACRQARGLLHLPPARPPWLPPLPALLGPDDLLPADPADGRDTATGTGTAGARRLVVGVVDLPAQQSRAPLAWEPAVQGHLAVAGAPGSGRTTVVRSLVAAALSARPAWHVHVLDGGGRLGALADLPQLGTVAPVGDTERVGRLFDHLAAAVRARPSGGAPPTVLLLDGWEQALDAWYPVEHGRLVDDLLRLARDGAAAGLRLAVTGGRALLGGPAAGLLTERWLLRAADPADLVVAGVPASALPGVMPPGRVLRVVPGGAQEAQVAVLRPVARPVADAGADPAAAGSGPAGSPPRAPVRLRALPDRLSLADLRAAVRGGAGADVLGQAVPVGLAGDAAAPDGPPAAGAGWIVAGPAGSGRSSVLAVAGHVLRGAGRPVVALAGRPSPVTALAGGGVAVVDPAAVAPALLPDTLLRRLDAAPGATLLVDDAALLGLDAGDPDRSLDDVLHDRLRHDTGAGPGPWPQGPGPHVLVACTAGEAAVAFRGVLPLLRRARCGVLVGAVGPGDGDALGVQVAPRPAGPPGRGLLVTAGQVRAVQLADPRPGGRPGDVPGRGAAPGGPDPVAIVGP